MQILMFLQNCMKITTVVTDSAFIHIHSYLLQWDAPTKICFTFKWTNEFNYMSYRPTGGQIITAKVMNTWTIISITPVCINMVLKIQCVSSSDMSSYTFWLFSYIGHLCFLYNHKNHFCNRGYSLAAAIPLVLCSEYTKFKYKFNIHIVIAILIKQRL
jgi:hypothetical protein